MKKILAIAMFGLVTGCSSVPLYTDTTIERAEFDLDCQADQLSVKNISGDTYAVKGCGKKAVYNCQCTFGVALQCTSARCEKES